MKKFFVALLMLLTIPAFATGVSSGASTADCDNATLNTYTGTSNLSAGWQPNTIDLHWYNGDTEITSGVQTSCTYDGTLTPPATIPTKTGYTFKGWTVRDVPDGYTKLQYLQSSGAAYIDTQYTGNQNTEIITKSLVTTTGRYVYGASTSSNARAITAYVSASGNWRMASSAIAVSNSSAYTINKIHNTKHNKNGVWVDGVQIGSYTNITNFTTPYSLLVFGGNTGSPGGNSGVRIYALSIKENDSLKRNFIPARRNSDDVVGMWDTVSKTFFTNSGTGSFIAGPVVPD